MKDKVASAHKNVLKKYFAKNDHEGCLVNMKILSIVCGGVSCYKYIDFARFLIKNYKAQIETILTKSASEFITPLLVSSATGNQCYVNDSYKMEHISLSRNVDVVVVFSATANFISSVAAGLGGNLALDAILAKNPETPIIFCPAMNPSMWVNPAIVSNVERLKNFGYLFCGPTSGEALCGESGSGRLESVENIANFVLNLVNCRKQKNGKKVVITTGATIEKIDDVRYISNHSSGLQGVLIANEFCKNGYDVILICGKIEDNVRAQILPQIKTINCLSAKQMLDKSLENMPCFCFIAVAAVCDFYVVGASNGKIKKSEGGLKTVNLAENEDILKTISSLPKERGANVVVGFAAEQGENLTKYAIEKIKTKGCNFIVANSIDGGFGGGNQALVKIFDKSGKMLFEAINTSKCQVAKQIVEIINEGGNN